MTAIPALRSRLRDERVRTWLSLAPALTVVAVLFGGAVVLAGLRSIGLLSPVAGDLATGPSLEAYRSLAGDPELQRAALLTLHVAATSTVLSVVLGVAAALTVHRLVRGRRLAITLLQLNLPIPHVIGAVAILALLGQSGLFARVGARTGLLDAPADFPALVFDPWAIGIIAQYVWKEVPFIAIVALAILAARGDRLDDAARTLGATGWQRLRHVTLPLLLPGVLSAAIIVFAFSFGTFEVPLLLGSSFPAVLPVLAYRRYTDLDLAARPEAMALSVLMTVIVVALVLLGAWLARRAVRADRADRAGRGDPGGRGGRGARTDQDGDRPDRTEVAP
ncbi:MAG: ABC transporter permease subunit [Nitriliruptoraceae bacterium]|nr:ABC transporter permease subunit [Nitriliruptoraceae bacterium]